MAGRLFIQNKHYWKIEIHPGETRLDPRFDLRNHSPTGFNFGYGGSGPAQLALALLAAVTDDETALNHYQQFKWDKIATFEGAYFHMHENEILEWLESQGAK